MSKGGYTPEPTPLEEAAADVAQQAWDRYQQTGVPTQSAFIEQTTGLKYDGNGGYVLSTREDSPLDQNGLVKHDSYQAIAGAEKAYSDVAPRFDPNTGRGLASTFNIEKGKLGTSSNADLAMQTAKTENEVKAIQNVIDIGRGQEASARTGLNDLASASAQQSREQAVNDYNQHQANMTDIGGLAGLGVTLGSDYFSKRNAK